MSGKFRGGTVKSTFVRQDVKMYPIIENPCKNGHVWIIYSSTSNWEYKQPVDGQPCLCGQVLYRKTVKVKDPYTEAGITKC